MNCSLVVKWSLMVVSSGVEVVIMVGCHWVVSGSVVGGQAVGVVVSVMMVPVVVIVGVMVSWHMIVVWKRVGG